MPEKPVPIVKTSVPGANNSIWSMRPLLRTNPGQDYYGRVFVEVWDQAARLVVNNPSLKARAFAALQSQQVPTPDIDIPWTNQPATGEIPGQAFLGRVVVEVWRDQEVVAITGSHPQVLAQAIEMLRQVIPL